MNQAKIEEYPTPLPPFLVVIGSFPLSEKAKKECFVKGRGVSGYKQIYHKGIQGSKEESPAPTLKYCNFYIVRGMGKNRSICYFLDRDKN